MPHFQAPEISAAQSGPFRVSVKFHQAVNTTRNKNQYQGDFRVTESQYYFFIMIVIFSPASETSGWEGSQE